MKPRVTMRKALSDPNLLSNALPGESWAAWRILLIAAMGEALTAEERVLFTQLTGREREPMQRVDEFAGVIGRRGGKTQAMGAYGTYIGAVCDHSDALARGEIGLLLCLAQDTKVAAKLLEFIEANLTGSPILRQMIKGHTQDSIELTNNISIEVRPASFRKLRGPTYVAVICDEIAYWYTELAYANPDVEILAAVRPGLLTTGGPLCLVSSPYSKHGVLWDRFRKHYGPAGDALTLVAHGSSRTFNPTLSQRVIDRALAEDRARNTAEYLAEFRSDIAGFVALEIVEACVGDYAEQLPRADITYRAFVDPSGGSKDSFTLAISHRDYRNDLVVIDAVRECVPPFSPEQVIEDFATLLKSYRVIKVTGDRYAGEFPRELFRKRDISYELSQQTKSELFRDFLPLLNSARVTLPRSDRLVSQIVSLERRVAPGGRETITHPDHGHDDLANAVAGAAKLSRYGGYSWDSGWLDDEPRKPPDPRPQQERVRLLIEKLKNGEPV
jgi:hypothetical protein